MTDLSEAPRIQVLSKLNPQQREAVRHVSSPLLVLAGAGSGKTGVITNKIAWLIRERGMQPRKITAVTFTNKAAGEMKERVEKLLGPVAKIVLSLCDISNNKFLILFLFCFSSKASEILSKSNLSISFRVAFSASMFIPAEALS